MLDLAVSGATLSQTIEAVRRLIRGHGNFVVTVTLKASATTTIVTNAYINKSAAVLLAPMTANAASALATTYVSSVTAGSITLTHANNAQTDRTFRVAIKGG